MTYYNWPEGVNGDIFNKNDIPVDNTVTSEFIGGRKIVHAVNTRQLYHYTFSLSFSVANGEHKRFFDWFSAIGGKAGVFRFPSLGNGYYRFLEIPEDSDTSMQSRNVSMSVEELY